MYITLKGYTSDGLSLNFTAECGVIMNPLETFIDIEVEISLSDLRLFFLQKSHPDRNKRANCGVTAIKYISAVIHQ